MSEQHITARQIRAARALLDWSQDDLAASSGLSVATVRKLELGHISPRGKTTNSILRAFEDSGLEFLEPNGVRQRPEEIRVYQGSSGFIEFFEDIYETAKNKGGDIVAVYASEIPLGFLGLEEFQKSYAEKMAALTGKLKVKNILTENATLPWADNYIEYRSISKHYVDSVCFHVYGDSCAFYIFNTAPSPKITVIKSREIAEAFRHQFYSMWEKATPLNKVERSAPLKKRA